MNNVTLKFTREFKYLGVIIDDRLKFIKHANFVIEKAKHIFYKLLIYRL